MKQGTFERLQATVFRCPGDPAAWETFAWQAADSLSCEHAQFVVFAPNGRIELQIA